MLPLLGLLALGAGAGGQDWYFQDQNKKAQSAVRGLLGTAPETLGADVAGPPSPGTGLMADPADPRRQLEFAAGVMGLGPRQRGAAATLFDSIMGRASQGALQREGWDRQTQAAAVSEGNQERRFQQEHAGIDARFAQTHQLQLDQFEQDKKRYGETQAWDRYKFGQQQALSWRADARAELESKRLEATKGADAGVKLPQGYERVIVQAPGGAPRIVARPVEGTPDWTKAQSEVDQLTLARKNIADFQESLKGGMHQVGAGAGTQKQLWSRVMASIGKLDELGTLQAGDLERLKEELPDPTTILSSPIRNDRMNAALAGLDATFGTKHQLARERYAGWNLRIPEEGARAEGRSAPPAGSVPVGGGAMGGSSSGRVRRPGG